jgi:hypothetical protein
MQPRVSEVGVLLSEKCLEKLFAGVEITVDTSAAGTASLDSLIIHPRPLSTNIFCLRTYKHIQAIAITVFESTPAND